MKRFVLATLCAVAVIAPLWSQAGRSGQDLASLIQHNDRKEALKRIRAGANVNAPQADGTSPLHWAVIRLDHELIQELLKRGAKPSVANAFGSTPIAEAAKLEDTRMIKLLLDAGAEPEGANADHETALMLAIKSGNLDNVRLLLNAGANPNNVETFHKQTPLMWAASADRNAGPMVDLLLSKGANPKPASLFTDWPSQISSEPRGQFRPVGGLTALLYAVRDGCLECAESLIKAGADVNVPTPEGVTPLMMALDNGHNEVAKLLLDRGAKPGVWDWWGRTPLYIAVDQKPAGGGGRGGRGGAAPATPVARGGANAISSMQLITTLLDMGVDPNVAMSITRPSRGGNSGRFGENQQSTGATPLFRAIQRNDMEVVRLLLAKGADPNINTMGYSAFLIAAGVSPAGRDGGGGGGPVNRELLDLLIQNKADPNVQVTDSLYSHYVRYQATARKEGTSALHAAAQRGDAEMVKYLLDHGADPNVLDAQGRKPADLIGAGGGAAAPKGKGGAGRGGPVGNAPAGNSEQIRQLLQSAPPATR